MDVLPSVYSKANNSQRRDAEDLLKTYSKLIQWRADGEDTVLDIGCGPGDVTIDFIVPLLPKGYKKLVGVDISDDMVRHANLLARDARISFQKWDMASDIQSLLIDHPEKFDHIFSLYTLHWHRDQQLITQNIFNLLTPNGDCLLLILAHHSVFHVYLSMSKLPKWKDLMPDKNQVTPPYQYKSNCAAIFRDYLRKAGFRKCKVEVSCRSFVYNSISEIKCFISAVNGYVKSMPVNEKEDYFRDFMKTLLELKMATNTDDENNLKFHTEYKLMIAYAQK